MLKISNPIEEIEMALPELKNIKSTYENVIQLTPQNWFSRLKSIETKNCKTFHHSLTAGSLNSYFHGCVIEIAGGDFVINKDAYNLIRKYVMSQKFNDK